LVSLLLVEDLTAEELTELEGKMNTAVNGAGAVMSRFGRALQLFPTGKKIQGKIKEEVPLI